MQHIDFSIVMPAYNDLALFRRTLESVRNQRDVTMELIVVDDSNRNDDIEHYVLRLNDERIVYRHNHPSLGAVRNWNSGLALAHGDYVTVVHHDEAMKDEHYLSMLKSVLSHKDVVVSNIEVQHACGKIYRLYPDFIKQIAIHVPSLLFAVNTFGPCAVVAARRSVVDMFDERTNWFVDVEWYYRLISNHRVSYLPDAKIVSFHGHEGQITNTIDTQSTAKADAQWLRRKYSFHIGVRLAMFCQIYILHNACLHKVLRKISGR